eukprot:COSAG02_NODE_6679_length_3423_cov_1.860108_3_plen_200_part_01
MLHQADFTKMTRYDGGAHDLAHSPATRRSQIVLSHMACSLQDIHGIGLSYRAGVAAEHSDSWLRGRRSALTVRVEELCNPHRHRLKHYKVRGCSNSTPACVHCVAVRVESILIRVIEHVRHFIGAIIGGRRRLHLSLGWPTPLGDGAGLIAEATAPRGLARRTVRKLQACQQRTWALATTTETPTIRIAEPLTWSGMSKC